MKRNNVFSQSYCWERELDYHPVTGDRKYKCRQIRHPKRNHIVLRIKQYESRGWEICTELTMENGVWIVRMIKEKAGV